MTQLSWLIYLSDVCGAISTVAGLLGFLVGIASLALTIGYYINQGQSGRERINFNPPLKRVWSLVAILVLISCLAPSRQTMLLIAASEISQRVILSGVLDPSLSLLKDTVENQIKELTHKEDRR